MTQGDAGPGQLRPVLSVVPDDLPDATLEIDELGSRIVGLAGRLAAATCRWLLLVAAFDARDGCASFGLGSTSRWLAHYCSLSQRTAVEHVRVARALAGHERLRVEMAAGRLSYSQVRAITRLADRGDPRLINELIMIAQHGTVRHLEDVVRGLRSVDDEERSRPPSEREQVTFRWRTNSQWAMSTRLDPERGAVVESAIRAVARSEGLSRADAVTRMAEIALAALAEGGGPATSLRGDQLAAIQIHVDADALPPEEPADALRSRERRRPAGRIVNGPGLPDPVLKRLLCSGRIRTVVFDRQHRPLDVGRNNRRVSQRVFAALLLRDGGCTHPGCGQREGLEAHHVRHWIHGGKTVMANLVLLCRRHHHAHHEGEFRIEALGRQHFRFRRADGRELLHHGEPARCQASTERLEDEHEHVPRDAATTRWDGTRLNLDYAVAVLAPGLRSVGRRPGYDPWAA